jgi:hypothetical protein
MAYPFEQVRLDLHSAKPTESSWWNRITDAFHRSSQLPSRDSKGASRLLMESLEPRVLLSTDVFEGVAKADYQADRTIGTGVFDELPAGLGLADDVGASAKGVTIYRCSGDGDSGAPRTRSIPERKLDTSGQGLFRTDAWTGSGDGCRLRRQHGRSNQTALSAVYNAVAVDGAAGVFSRGGTASFDSFGVSIDDPALATLESKGRPGSRGAIERPYPCSIHMPRKSFPCCSPASFKNTKSVSAFCR